MSEVGVYLVPVDEPAPQRNLCGPVLRYLKARGIVNGLYDDELGWYAAGPHSTSLFTGSEQPAFEYAIIYDDSRAQFVPNSHSAGFGSSCASCKAELDEQLYDYLNEQAEAEAVSDAASHAIACPCGHSNSLVTLRAQIDTAVTRFYLNFCAVDGEGPDAAIVKDLEGLLGCQLRIIWERV